MKKKVNLKGRAVCLRTFAEADIPLKVRWFNDPVVNRNLILRGPIEESETSVWFQAAVNDPNRCDLTIEKAGYPIGCIGLRQINYQNKTAGYYIVIGEKQYWGQGYAKEASELLFRWAFRELHLNKIWSNVTAENTSSMALLKKLGFQQEGFLREEEVVDDKKVDIVRFGLLASEYFG